MISKTISENMSQARQFDFVEMRPDIRGDERTMLASSGVSSQPFMPVSATLSMMRRRRIRNTTSIGSTLRSEPAISLP